MLIEAISGTLTWQESSQTDRVHLLDIHRQNSEQPALREYEARLLCYRTEQTSRVGKATVQQVCDDLSI